MPVSSDTSDYAAAVAYLYGRLDYERNATPPHKLQGLHLERMEVLLAKLGNPQRQLRTVHVAGTKGKGSTAAMIGSILSAARYRAGVYSSPHLDCLEERMTVNGVQCTPEELVALLEAVRPVIDEMDREAEIGLWNSGPTFFEATTALAWLHFLRHGVDFAVMEVGMGGRLDSTNVCEPVVSVITSISYDHTRQLGNTLSSIAREKAGIIKPGVPVVSGVVQPEPREVVQKVADTRGSQLFQVGREFTYRYRPPQAIGQHGIIEYEEGPGGDPISWQGLPLRLLGRHQAANAANALATIGRLKHHGWELPDEAVRAGLARTQCPARIELVQHNPTVILDTAHNLASVAALLEVLEEIGASSGRVLIFAATQGKDVRGMLRQLLPHFDRVVLTRYLNNPRSAPVDRLAGWACQLAAQLAPERPPDDWISVCHTPASAWQLGRALAEQDGLLCVTGSFFLAAELRPLLEASRAEKTAWCGL